MADLNPPKLIMDDYQQLVIDSLVHTNIVSDGNFSDFSESGFMRPFAGTMAYIGSELLYNANKSSEAAAKSFLANVLGVLENTGTRAITLIQFGLSTALTTDFVVPPNYQVSDSSGTLRFYTTNALVISAGNTVGTMTAIAEETGERYNVSEGFINTFSTPLNYLSYVINVESSQGGSSPETATDLVERAARIIRLRNPVSALDFEQLATFIMGEGSRARCIGLLGINKIVNNIETGVIHLFLLDATGTPAPESLRSLVGNTVSSRLMLGTRLLISPVEQEEVNVSLICRSDGTKTFQEVSDQIFQALINFFDHRTYGIGDDVLIEEVKFAVRSVGGFVLTYLEINESPLNVPMPNQWTQPKFTGVNLEIVDVNGATFTDSQFIVGGSFE